MIARAGSTLAVSWLLVIAFFGCKQPVAVDAKAGRADMSHATRAPASPPPQKSATEMPPKLAWPPPPAPLAVAELEPVHTLVFSWTSPDASVTAARTNVHRIVDGQTTLLRSLPGLFGVADGKVFEIKTRRQKTSVERCPIDDPDPATSGLRLPARTLVRYSETLFPYVAIHRLGGRAIRHDAFGKPAAVVTPELGRATTTWRLGVSPASIVAVERCVVRGACQAPDTPSKCEQVYWDPVLAQRMPQRPDSVSPLLSADESRAVQQRALGVGGDARFSRLLLRQQAGTVVVDAEFRLQNQGVGEYQVRVIRDVQLPALLQGVREVPTALRPNLTTGSGAFGWSLVTIRASAADVLLGLLPEETRP